MSDFGRAPTPPPPRSQGLTLRNRVLLSRPPDLRMGVRLSGVLLFSVALFRLIRPRCRRLGHSSSQSMRDSRFTSASVLPSEQDRHTMYRSKQLSHVSFPHTGHGHGFALTSVLHRSHIHDTPM